MLEDIEQRVEKSLTVSEYKPYVKYHKRGEYKKYKNNCQSQ